MASPTDNKNRILWVGATLAVVIIFQISYGLSALLPSNISWLMTARHDWGTHYLGWAFFKNEPWHFPLGNITGYNYPVGTNVGYTDSIPLLAIFFKLFGPLLSSDFQYFGIWLFLCHLLAAYFTILLFRLFKVNWIVTLAATVFIASNPVLVYRGMHPALCGQWMLIAAIYFYFLDIQDFDWRKILRYQFWLLVFSATINPYLCWMVMGFSFATPVKLWLYRKKFGWKYLILYLATSLFSVWLVWFITGMVTLGKKETFWVNGAYGLYGLNLNALYNPVGYSPILPQLKQVSWHQYEGFMYLGVGMLLLLFVLLMYFVYVGMTNRSEKKSNKPRFSLKKNSNVPLYVLILGLTLFSTTLVFTFNDKVLLNIPAPGFFIQLEEIFRASARFFWVSYYLIVLFILIGLAKSRIKPVITVSMIILALIIQLYDLNRLLTSRNMTYGTYVSPMNNEAWIKLMRGFDEVLFFPAFTSPNIRDMVYQDFSYLALKAGKPVNLAYVAREDGHSIKAFSDSLTQVLESGNLSPRALYITDASHVEYFSKAIQSSAAVMDTLDGCFYIFVNNNRNDSLKSGTIESFNTKSKKILDSVLLRSHRTGFAESGKLPVVDNHAIRYNLERINIGDGVISMSGWAFIDSTKNNKQDSIFVTLISEDHSYLAPVNMSSREDVAKGFGKPDASNAGLSFLAFTYDIKAGYYQVGLAIKDAQGRFVFQTVGREMKIKVSEYVIPEKINHLPAEGAIQYDLVFSETKDEFSAGGWAVLKNQDADSSKISLVLKNGKSLYILPTKPFPRPDVSAIFKNQYKLDNSGFNVKFLKIALKSGRYDAGLIIRDNRHKTESFIATDKAILVP